MSTLAQVAQIGRKGTLRLTPTKVDLIGCQESSSSKNAPTSAQQTLTNRTREALMSTLAQVTKISHQRAL